MIEVASLRYASPPDPRAFVGRQLSLSTNCIDRIIPLAGMKNLKILSLGRNCIKKVGENALCMIPCSWRAIPWHLSSIELTPDVVENNAQRVDATTNISFIDTRGQQVVDARLCLRRSCHAQWACFLPCSSSADRCLFSLLSGLPHTSTYGRRGFCYFLDRCSPYCYAQMGRL